MPRGPSRPGDRGHWGAGRRRVPRQRFRGDGRRATRSATRVAQTRHKRDIRNRPHPGLLSACQVGFDQNRIGQQAEHRARIRKREEAVWHRAAIRSRIPRLQQRAGGRQQKIRQSHGRGQQARECAAAGLRRPAASTTAEGRIGSERKLSASRTSMNDRLRPAGLPIHPVRIRIAAKQRHLEEQHATRPDRSGAAEPRQDQLGDQRLHLE